MVQELPKELRTHDVIGALGWDLPEFQILERAREVLSAAEVKEGDDFTHLSVTCEPGSLAELFFNDAVVLAKAKVAVHNLKTKVPNQSKQAWLDVQKTSSMNNLFGQSRWRLEQFIVVHTLYEDARRMSSGLSIPFGFLVCSSRHYSGVFSQLAFMLG